MQIGVYQKIHQRKGKKNNITGEMVVQRNSSNNNSNSNDDNINNSKDGNDGDNDNCNSNDNNSNRYNTVNCKVKSRYIINVGNENDVNNGNINDNVKKSRQNEINQHLRNDREQNNGKKIDKEIKEKLENKQEKGIIKIGYININGINITSTIDLEEECKDHGLEMVFCFNQTHFS